MGHGFCAASPPVQLNLLWCRVYRSLILSDNPLSASGTFPDVIAGLSKLKLLDMSRDGLTGTVPDAISALSALQSLALSGNYFSGAFPELLSSLPSLVSLDLSDTGISGDLPAFTNSLTTLKCVSVTSCAILQFGLLLRVC